MLHNEIPTASIQGGIYMKFIEKAMPVFFAIVLLAGCATIKGNSFAEQREYVLDMKDDTLARLYTEFPIAKEQIKKSAGYWCVQQYQHKSISA